MAHLLFLKIKENCQQLSLVNKSHKYTKTQIEVNCAQAEQLQLIFVHIGTQKKQKEKLVNEAKSSL